MSDNEYYSDNNSESESESETSDTEVIKTPLFKPNVIKKISKDINSDSDSDSDIQEDGVGDDDDDDYDNKVVQKVNIEDDDDYIEDDADDSDIELDEDGEPIQKVVTQKSDKKVKKPQLIVQDDEDDEDDEYDDNYLQKFDNDIMKNYINEFHPECLSHSYDEIAKLSIVVRNSDNIIIDPLHRTIPYLTKYERARILGQRAKQIETGAKPLVKIPENIVDSYIIAELELKEKKIPFIIRRPIPGGACEYWTLKDLEIIAF